MDLPMFRYHPDPLRSGSIVRSEASCLCCGRARGFIYSGPVYAEADLDDAICPWCIADGSAGRKFDATFVDANGVADGAPDSVVEEITERTPGYCAWQTEAWPVCCGDAAAFIGPVGIAEIRKDYYEREGELMGYIVHEMGISGGAARRLLEALKRDQSPTAYLFRCLKCEAYRFHVDSL